MGCSFGHGLATYSGPHASRALLFPMEEVFEDFVTAAFRRHQRRFAYGWRYGCQRVVLGYPRTPSFARGTVPVHGGRDLELVCLQFDVSDAEASVRGAVGKLAIGIDQTSNHQHLVSSHAHAVEAAPELPTLDALTMTNSLRCPLCIDAVGASSTVYETASSPWADCHICGKYTMTMEPFMRLHSATDPANRWSLTALQRAVLSHRIRTKSDVASSQHDLLCVTAPLLESIRSEGQLPSVASQAANAIRFIGDHISQAGHALDEIPDEFHTIVGAMDRNSSEWLLRHLQDHGVIDIGADTATTRQHPSGSGSIIVKNLRDLRLTLTGWEQYEAAQHGRFRADYGFIAMQFDDPTLDSLVEDAIKPIIQNEMGYRLVDMRDLAQAGVIDNIMRMAIRDAAFVIADLTHGNQGAYWEAGYAEGLKKPVVYICEKSAFEKTGTHFDTNHCTTVPWRIDDQDEFCKELVATLRRSLDLGS